MLDSKFFEDHAISMQVAEARPYIRFEQNELESVLDDYSRYNLHRFGDRQLTDAERKAVKNERNHLKRIVAQSGGYIISRNSYGGFHSGGASRFDVDGAPCLHNPSASAELRPDKAILTDPRKHWHFHPTVMPEEWPIHPTSGNPLPKRSVHLAENMSRHIAKSSGGSLINAHGGVNDETVHWHQKKAKYVFLSGPEHAKRIDVHPFAFRRLTSVGRVYFGLEGCIKADAILTAILETGEDASVISVPSVTLWDSIDLNVTAYRFMAPRGTGWDEPGGFVPEIVIVCDADWFTNPLVKEQALLCRAILRSWGYDACIAAPPICRHTGAHANCTPGQKCRVNGVDDFLANGGRLEELVVLHREAPALSQLIDLQHMRSDKRATCARMLTGLAEHADNDGGFEGSIEKLGRVVGLPRRTAYNGITYLVDHGLIHNDRPLLLQRKRWIRGVGEVSPFDWEDRPRFTLPEHLRAEPFRFFRLRHWHDDEKEAMDRLLYELLDEVHALRGDVQAQTSAMKRHEDRLRELFPTSDEIGHAIDIFLADALAA